MLRLLLLLQALTKPQAPATWEDWAKVAAVLTVSQTALVFIFRPVIDRMHLSSHSRSEAEHDRLWVAALHRNTASVKEDIDKLYADRIKRVDEAVNAVPGHEERIEMLYESVTAQGKALTEEFSRTMQGQTKMMEEVAKHQRESMERMAKDNRESAHAIQTSLSAIQKEANANAQAISQVHGILQGAGFPTGVGPFFTHKRRDDTMSGGDGLG